MQCDKPNIRTVAGTSRIKPIGSQEYGGVHFVLMVGKEYLFVAIEMMQLPVQIVTKENFFILDRIQSTD